MTVHICRSGHWGTGTWLLDGTSSPDLRAGLEARSLTASRGSLSGAPPKVRAVSRLLCARRKIPAPGLHLGLGPTDIFPFGTELGMRKETCISPKWALEAHTGFHTPPAQALPAIHEVRQRPLRCCVLGGPRRCPGEQAPGHQPSGAGDLSVPVIHTQLGPGQGGVATESC